ncbi:MAG TPA: LysM peptidoglycan-binding domain-containing protein, partial [Flavobacteriales bacterium]|nr:LysM peptidoglycan-binding domain-containing protein [Flavobacteriales bacterium]
ATATRSNEAGPTRTHVVRRGESLGSIARKHRVSVGDLRAWNRLKSDRLRAGQRLVVRKATASSSAPAAPPKPDERTVQGTPAAVEYIYHTVQPGDTLWGIAQRYPGISVDEIKRLNGDVNLRKLAVGKRIKVGVQKG